MRPVCKLFCISMFLLSGCYLSHERAVPSDCGPPSDASAVCGPYADIVIDLVRRSGGSEITFHSREGASFGSHFMQFAAINRGSRAGTLDRLVFDTRVVSIDSGGLERPASIHDVLTSCLIYHQAHPIPDEGDPMYSARIVGEQIIFDHAHLSVSDELRGTTAEDFQEIFLHCRLEPNTAVVPLGGRLRVWLSMSADTGVTLEEGPPARAGASLSLQVNTDPDLVLDFSYHMDINFRD